jgi:hypothetical protein
MMDIDLTWLALGLFFLGCGGLPAAMALLAERRGAVRLPQAALRQEKPLSISPTELHRIRRSLAAFG